MCGWEDRDAREQLVADLAADAHACLGLLEGRELTVEVAEAVELLATVVGQDLEAGDDGRLRIARRVARDRVISTVDPDARHGHKTQARGFDGYRGHAALGHGQSDMVAVIRAIEGPNRFRRSVSAAADRPWRGG